MEKKGHTIKRNSSIWPDSTIYQFGWLDVDRAFVLRVNLLGGGTRGLDKCGGPGGVKVKVVRLVQHSLTIMKLLFWVLHIKVTLVLVSS